MQTRMLYPLAACAAALLLGACAEDEGCSSDKECPSGQVCNSGFCEAPSGDAEADATSTDGSTAEDGDAGATDVADAGTLDDAGTGTGADAATGGDVATIPDTTAPVDTAKPQDVPVQWDLGRTNPDEEPPTVLSTSPAAGEEGVALPVKVTITFSEPMRAETIDENNVRVLSITGKSIGGKPELSADKTTVTLTPDPTKVTLVSPYTISVDAIVQDVAGNHLGAPFIATFYTTTPPNLGGYAQMAAALAPTVQVAVNGTKPVVSYPTRIDADGDWDAMGNASWVQEKAKSLPAAVYWDVAETQSHLYFTYTYFWPYRDTTGTPKTAHANDTAGVLIVASKLPELTPVAAYTYGRDDEVEEVFAWVAAGTDLAGKPNVTKAVDPAVLFVDGRFQGYLTTPSHQSCTWVASGPGACELNAGIQASLMTAVYALDQGIATSIQPKGGTWPSAGESIDFQLLHGLTAFWARRGAKGEGGVFDGSFDYEPISGRPGSNLKGLPSLFQAAMGTYGGRPGWAWNWKPAQGSFFKMGRGTIFLDPAIFVEKRHSLKANWDTAAKTGFSNTYCFHPYLGIDERGKLDDCPAE